MVLSMSLACFPWVCVWFSLGAFIVWSLVLASFIMVLSMFVAWCFTVLSMDLASFVVVLSIVWHCFVFDAGNSYYLLEAYSKDATISHDFCLPDITESF